MLTWDRPRGACNAIARLSAISRASRSRHCLRLRPRRADDAADFYRGRTLSLVAGFNVGGGADTYARLIARHLGAHLPGNPTVVVKNMQGAGSSNT